MVKFAIGLLSIEANTYLREKDVDLMMVNSWAYARKLMEKRFFKSSHSSFARQEAENFKQEENMSVDDYFNGIIERLFRVSSKINEAEASALILRNMRPGLSRSIRRLHPCEEWTIESLRSYALRHQAEYENRQLEEKREKSKNQTTREFTNTNRGGGRNNGRGRNGGFPEQRRQFQGKSNGFTKPFSSQSGESSQTAYGDAGAQASSDASTTVDSGQARGGYQQRRPFNNYRNRRGGGNFRGGYKPWSGQQRQYTPATAFRPKETVQVTDTNGLPVNYESYLEYLNGLRPVVMEQRRTQQ